ncbi:MAG: PAS domain-containing protein, partial [Bacteroidetes bacterium]|nr:PAS domain-containing protein [Bacteroidota bacterium]
MRRFSHIIRLFFFCAAIVIQKAEVHSQEYFDQYSIEEGLSQTLITGILQDNDGFIWIATQDGLNRFDGKTFRKFFNIPDDSTSLSFSLIYAIAQDEKGDLWIGTRNGLNRYDREKNSFTRYMYAPDNIASVPHEEVLGVLIDNENTVWINTYHCISEMKEDERFVHYYHVDTNLRNPDMSFGMPVIQSEDGIIWVSTFNGLYSFDKQTSTFRAYTHDDLDTNSISNNYVQSIFEDSRGRIWAGTQGGLNRLDRISGRFRRFPLSLSGNDLSTGKIQVIYEDHQHNLWIGTYGDGLSVLSDLGDQSGCPYVTYLHDPCRKNGISCNEITTLFTDRSYNMWIGTYSGGLNKLDLKNKKFNLINNAALGGEHSLSSNDIASVFKDRQGRLWIGTWGNGLNIYNRKNGEIEFFSAFSGKQRLSDDYIHVIVPDSKGNIWLGTENGIDIWSEADKQFHSFSDFFSNISFPQLYSNRVNAIVEDDTGNFWIGTYNGLHVFSSATGKIRSYYAGNNNNSLCHNKIYSILLDTAGTLWIGTVRGMNRYLPESDDFVQYRKQPNSVNSINNNRIFSICEDHKGYLWIATESGINRYDRQTNIFENITGNSGKFHNVLVYDILQDDVRNLWFSSNIGLIRYEYSTGKLRVYDTRDGLQGLEFNNGACYKAEDGELFFGGINGLNTLFPGQLMDNSYIPSVVVTSVDIVDHYGNGKKAKTTDGIVKLDWSDMMLTIEFATLEYSKPEKNLYRYRMQGISEEWIDLGNDNSVTFMNMEPGEYTFSVTGSNNDGIWNDKPEVLDIIVSPPWWQTTWAYAGYVIAVLLAVFTTMKIRERRHISEKRNLEQKVQERTEEIKDQAEELRIVNVELEKLSLVASKTDSSVIIANKFGTIEWINDGFTRLYGYSLNDFITEKGDRIATVTGNEEAFEKKLDICIKKKKSVTFTTFAENRDKQELWIQINLVPVMDDKDELKYLLAVSTDITKIKKAEEEVSRLLEIAVNNQAEAEKQRVVIEERNQQIRDSIMYARRIQQTILPSEKIIREYLPGIFILYRPRDIVSGDFYWYNQRFGQIHLAAADCTGHGVPGAFLSFVGYSELNKVIENSIEPGNMLDMLNRNIFDILNREPSNDRSVREGMDISLCCIDIRKRT